MGKKSKKLIRGRKEAGISVNDLDGDGRAEIAIAPQAAGSAGNDFWVMEFR